MTKTIRQLSIQPPWRIILLGYSNSDRFKTPGNILRMYRYTYVFIVYLHSISIFCKKHLLLLSFYLFSIF